MKCGRKRRVVAHEGGRKRGVLLYKKEENNNFQCQLSRIYFYMEKNPHFRDSRYITIPADV